jgi:hypothetical protein
MDNKSTIQTADDIYIPIEQNHYNYEAMYFLEKNIDYFLTDNKITKVNVLGFKINNESKYPFLEYLLYKNPSTQTLSIPWMSLTTKDITSEIIVEQSQMLLRSMLNCKNDDDNLNNVECKGFYIKNEVYIFYDLSKCELHPNYVYKTSKMWFCLIDEIVNTTHICNFKIDKSVSNFFAQNDMFCFLKNKNNVNYEVPVIGYIGRHTSMLNFTYVFGVSKSDSSAILGPYFYFTDYLHAINQGGWSKDGKSEIRHDKLMTDNSKGRYKSGGIIRFALFMDKTKVIQNQLLDEIDESEIKKERLLDGLLDGQYERLTMRISDHDGNWSKNYDSVFIGNIELDNGDKVKNAPLIVLKEYDQQIPLSYHYIDKKYLGENFDDTANYYIM